MSHKTSKFRKMFRIKTRNKSRINRLRPLAGLLAAGLSLPGLAAAQSKEFPTYVTGPQPNGSWVVSDGAGYHASWHPSRPRHPGSREGYRAEPQCPHPHRCRPRPWRSASKAPSKYSTPIPAMSCRTTTTFGEDAQGSYDGIAYSADGKHLVFSQDSSNVTITNVTAEGLLEDNAQVSVPANNTFITCFKNSPPGSYAVPCGTFYSPSTSYPGGLALSQDGRSAYALLNQNDTLAQIDLTTDTQGYADPRRQRAAQRRDRQQGHDRLRQQRGWPGGHGSGLPDLVRRH